MTQELLLARLQVCLDEAKTCLDQARSKYKSTQDSLQKLHGQKTLQDRKRPIGGVSRRDSENGGGGGGSSRRANDGSATGGPPAVKRAREGSSVFERLAMPPLPPVADVPLSEYQRSRKAAIKELAAAEDRQVRERNKRMFGVMLGTLKQFSAAERDRERQSSYQQRRELEERVEEGVKKDDERVEEGIKRDQERLRRDCEQLAREKRRRVDKIKQLEEQVRLVELHATWRKATEALRGSIRTLADSHPHRLFYRPKVFCERARRRRELTARQVDAEIADRESRMRAEVERVVEAAAAADDADTSASNDEEAEEGRKKDDAGRRSRNRSSGGGAGGGVKRMLSSVAVVVAPPAPTPPPAPPPPTASSSAAAVAAADDNLSSSNATATTTATITTQQIPELLEDDEGIKSSAVDMVIVDDDDDGSS